ncbi:hypothetical protein HYH03_010574 [Edaphochlamys debaryana]|uniref:Uncharacterized protein n=1 Tax=Edaphochlamys debaryana TaxID=47281 RepID=A0A835XVV2_9CHLO|nr:hypothetical protein HYH03_010574 [Edaphochlamys debaryana]|eukprot:KAG2491131.1 hypothetical protein HYH03_010574 [Edaphochlamys debaryana]
MASPCPPRPCPHPPPQAALLIWDRRRTDAKLASWAASVLTFKGSLPPDTVPLVAKALGAAVKETDMPPALQLATPKAVDQALTAAPQPRGVARALGQALLRTAQSGGHVARAVGTTLRELHGGLWSCVRGWEDYAVHNRPGTYMCLVMRGVRLVVFQGRSEDSVPPSQQQAPGPRPATAAAAIGGGGVDGDDGGEPDWRPAIRQCRRWLAVAGVGFVMVAVGSFQLIRQQRQIEAKLKSWAASLLDVKGRLPPDTVSAAVPLVAKALGAAVKKTDMPPALQLTTFRAVDQALKERPSRRVAREQGYVAWTAQRVRSALESELGGRWSCVTRCGEYDVSFELGTYMVMEMRGRQLMVFRVRGEGEGK